MALRGNCHMVPRRPRVTLQHRCHHKLASRMARPGGSGAATVLGVGAHLAMPKSMRGAPSRPLQSAVRSRSPPPPSHSNSVSAPPITARHPRCCTTRSCRSHVSHLHVHQPAVFPHTPSSTTTTTSHTHERRRQTLYSTFPLIIAMHRTFTSFAQLQSRLVWSMQ